ncbi:MAG: hypothetical protein KAI50_10280 [Desulfobacterales bacterium]|nr:hypothetical protein [Desulfobacterales bacterium]
MAQYLLDSYYKKTKKIGEYKDKHLQHSVINKNWYKGINYDSGREIKNYRKEVVRLISCGGFKI